ncbi:MAG: FAD-dependent oxidoreductase [Spirochaetaceae bacterium]
MKNKTVNTDFCIVGGGMSGLCAAIASARKGIKTLLVQDRPMLGGNSSSEIRMWICGAHGENNHETGILEEILLENAYRQTNPNYSVWDSILWEKAHFQENLTLILNCSINNSEMNNTGTVIKSLTGWQMTTETWIKIEANIFSDCSGDGILAPLTGAEFRVGREAKSEFNESIAPEKADKKTMGMSCLIQARETDKPQKFIAPEWAHKFENDSDFPNRSHSIKGNQNFWWLEVGGMDNSIDDTEECRDELLKIAYGVWDHVKNYDKNADHDAENWTLDWLGFLPGKRESRRLVGDYILTQNDIEKEGKHFNDIVAYGGWSMDDHYPEGFYNKIGGTIFHPAPSPYGIPLRSLYSKNIENLFFAGRNISATHSALSSTRVMATCSLLGQAVGEAASICIENNILPREVYRSKIIELQNRLKDSDCYLPWQKRVISHKTTKANIKTSNNDSGEVLRNGNDRDIKNQDNGYTFKTGAWVEFRFSEDTKIDDIRFVFDSNLSRSTHNMVSYYKLNQKDFSVPGCLLKEFVIEIEDKNDIWTEIYKAQNNYQRLVSISLSITTKAIRVKPIRTWDDSSIMKIFSIDIV